MAHGPGLYETLRDLTAGAGSRSDAVLLDRFLAARDQEAFTTLLNRHGPLVWGVCRRVLGREHDAEDAFQATFLVLAHKAASIRRRGSLTCWLHGVALRIALRAKADIRKRFYDHPTDPPARDNDPADIASAAERASAVDEQIRRLPERYRRPLVLCYLLGRTQEEAARELGWPKGSVAVRLARGRERLRRPLQRRGLDHLVAVPLLPAAPLPNQLVTSTRNATASYQSGGLPPARAHTLAKGALTAMFFDKCKAVLFLALAAGVLAASGVGSRALLAQPPAPSSPPASASANKPGSPTKAETAASKLPDLLKERVEAASTEFRSRYEQFEAGRGETNITLEAAGRALHASLAVSPSNQQKIAVWQEHVDRLKAMVDINQARYAAGRCAVADLSETRYYYLEALIELERLKSP